MSTGARHKQEVALTVPTAGPWAVVQRRQFRKHGRSKQLSNRIEALVLSASPALHQGIHFIEEHNGPGEVHKICENFIGANVTEMIAEVVVARNLETTGHEIIKSIHPHPTMSEAIMEAVAAAYGEVIHI